MSTSAAVAKRERATISRPLKVLIPLIQTDIERGDRAGMEYYADAGAKLIEAKSQVAYGYWGTWVSKNFGRTQQQAGTYMRLARLRDEQKNEGGAFNLPNSLRDMTGHTQRDRKRKKRDREFKSVLRELETDLYAQEQQTRDEEIRLHRALALELIDVGFKALATRLHPDRGGPKDAMLRLNRVRDELKGVAETRRFI